MLDQNYIRVLPNLVVDGPNNKAFDGNKWFSVLIVESVYS